MKAEEAVRYLRYCQVNKETHDMRSQHAADLIEAQAKIVDATNKWRNNLGCGCKGCEMDYIREIDKSLAELEEVTK